MTVDYQELRVKMVDGQVRTTDVTNSAILSAMLSVPRELFVSEPRRPLAYIDEDIEVAPAADGRSARYLMEPSPLARLLQLAEIRFTDRVLDIGTGTGYSAAVLSKIAASVVALESDPSLASAAKATLADLGFANATVVEGALEAGHASSAPYDVIFINGAVDSIPTALFDQLADGGRLVAVVGNGMRARATFFFKDKGVVSERVAFNAAVRPLDAFRSAPAFTF